jgi:hypothetical protein
MTNQVRVARSSSLIDSPPKYKTLCTKCAEEPNWDPVQNRRKPLMSQKEFCSR